MSDAPVAPAVEVAGKRLRVNEIFFSIQGESTRAGRPCVFVRLTGCQMRCRWCDTTYSFYEGGWQTIGEILAEVEGHGCGLVEVTGGEPLLQPAVLPLLSSLCDRGYEVLLETGGGLDVGAVDSRVRRIIDIKCPGSGEHENNHWRNLDLIGFRDELKFVLADRADFEWAVDLVRRRDLAGRSQVLFAPLYGELEPRLLAEWILALQLPVQLQLQLHKLLWGEARGV